MSLRRPLIENVPEKIKPLAFARVSNISGIVRGVFEADANGKAPDVELRTERMIPLFTT